MSIVLELREHLSHSGTPLVHPASEDVLLSNVFGVVKNLPATSVLVPWLRAVTGLKVAETTWAISFWEKQPRPIGIREGNTVVDLVLDSVATLVFVEVKMDAPASSGTTSNPNRNQLARNLDIGYRRATDAAKEFALIFVTPDIAQPPLVNSIRSGDGPFPVNPGVAPASIAPCLHWASWASIGDVIADAYSSNRLSDSESGFALDLLATSLKSGSGRITSTMKQVFIPINCTGACSATHRRSYRTRSNGRSDTTAGATSPGTKRDSVNCCGACAWKTRRS